SYNLGNSTTAWSNKDLTAATASTLAAAGSSLAAFYAKSTGFEHIAYLGTNRHVCFLSFDSSSSSWKFSDPTAATGNTLAVAGSDLAAYEDASTLPATLKVVYIGANQHVYQLSLNAATAAWSNQDLTALTGNTLAVSGSALAAVQGIVNDNLHIIYLGTNAHVYQLWFNVSAATWANQDLTAGTGNTLAESGSALHSSLTVSAASTWFIWEGTSMSTSSTGTMRPAPGAIRTSQPQPGTRSLPRGAR